MVGQMRRPCRPGKHVGTAVYAKSLKVHLIFIAKHNLLDNWKTGGSGREPSLMKHSTAIYSGFKLAGGQKGEEQLLPSCVTPSQLPQVPHAPNTCIDEALPPTDRTLGFILE